MKINIKGPIISDGDQWIYDWIGISATSPGKVNRQLNRAVANEALEVTINSGGGSVFDASEIYTSLKDYPGDVTVKIVGVAASAASVIAMAGDKVMMSPTAQMMIHNASVGSRGDYRVKDHNSAFLKNVNQTIANAYNLKSGRSYDELLKMMDAETWLTPQQAKENNLIDEIMFEAQPSQVVASHDSGMIPQEVLEKLRNELKLANPESGIPTNPVVVNNIQTKKEDDKEMTLEELKNQHPELYKQVKDEGYEDGVKAENDRIKEIEDLQMPGNEEIINNAKYQSKVTASEVAVQIVKAEKQRGQNFISARNDDAAQLSAVQGNHAPLSPQNDSDKEKNILLNSINSMFGGNQR